MHSSNPGLPADAAFSRQTRPPAGRRSLAPNRCQSSVRLPVAQFGSGSNLVRSQLLTGVLMHHRVLVVASLMLLAACSNAPTKEEAPDKVAAPVTAAQRPTDASTTPAPPVRAAPVTEASSPLKDPSNILSRRSVFFDYDQSLIKDPDKPLLEAHANYLRQHPSTKVVVQGNTDERGSREYNIALGQLRADAVKRFLMLLGAEDRQVDTVSFGKEKPRCTLGDESCWSQNRRADLVYGGD